MFVYMYNVHLLFPSLLFTHVRISIFSPWHCSEHKNLSSLRGCQQWLLLLQIPSPETIYIVN